MGAQFEAPEYDPLIDNDFESHYVLVHPSVEVGYLLRRWRRDPAEA